MPCYWLQRWMKCCTSLGTQIWESPLFESWEILSSLSLLHVLKLSEVWHEESWGINFLILKNTTHLEGWEVGHLSSDFWSRASIYINGHKPKINELRNSPTWIRDNLVAWRFVQICWKAISWGYDISLHQPKTILAKKL